MTPAIEPTRRKTETTGIQWVALADCSPVVSDGLQVFFQDTHFQINERVSTIADMRRVLVYQEVHVVISELAIADANLDELIELCRLHRKPHLLYSTSANPDFLGRAYRAGIAGWISKSATKVELINGLAAAATGSRIWTRRQTRQIIGSLVAKELSDKLAFPLTDRELEVLRLFAAGHSNQKIADRLNIGFETVKEHVQRVLAKIGVNDRTQAAVFAERNDVL